MLRVNEKFVSIQGEGRFMGAPMSFIRLQGCDLACSWCDTEWKTGGKESVESVAAWVRGQAPYRVCITGGEPTLQAAGIEALVREFLSYRFHLETHGRRVPPLASTFECITTSPKLPSSGNPCEPVGFAERWRKYLPQVKFVVASGGDWGALREAWAGELRGWAGPVVVQAADGFDLRPCIADHIAAPLSLDLRFMPRYHVDLWGQERGR